jgi:UDP-N-acetylglucosamine acyltransferase
MPISRESGERASSAKARVSSSSADMPGSGVTVIHPSAVIEPGAVIDKGATIGPYCVVGGNVTVGEDCKLVSHVHVAGQTSIGARTIVYPFASLGGPPQSLNYRGTLTRLTIGTDCDIRHNVTINAGTEDGGGITKVGDRGYFMANSHVAHDCEVGSDAVFANCATLGGHCILGDHVFMGGLAGVHQFSRVGSNAMIAGAAGVRGDVIPFGLAAGPFARLRGINVVGMKRRKFSTEEVKAVRLAFRMLFFGKELMDRRLEEVESKFGDNKVVAEIVAFIRSDRSRPLCHASASQDD